MDRPGETAHYVSTVKPIRVRQILILHVLLCRKVRIGISAKHTSNLELTRARHLVR
jgi:hypothetical protein